MKKQVIELNLDILQGPIWGSDPTNFALDTDIEIIDNDEELKKLNYEIFNMYSSY